MCGKCCAPPVLRALWRPVADGSPGHTDEGDTPQAVACHLPGNDHREGAHRPLMRVLAAPSADGVSRLGVPTHATFSQLMRLPVMQHLGRCRRTDRA